VLLVAAVAGCNHEADARAEAKLLLDKLHALSGDGTLTQRKAALDALSALPLHEAEHGHTRDLCHSAHRQLLEAEAAQLSARKALDEAASAAQPGSSLSPERGQAIAAELERSNAALMAAKKSFPECEQATLALTREAR
jgi:hypothetical protein